MPRSSSWIAFVLALIALGSSASVGQERRWTFDDDAPGVIARGLTNEAGTWSVVRSDSGNALAQSAKNAKTAFNITLSSDIAARELEMSVRMKAIAGLFDQGGGLVWRARDARNYYFCRYDPLEDNFRLYKVIDGKLSLLQSADVGKTPGWHTLGVTMTSDRIECYFDGKKLLAFDDPTFTAAGKIGLWTKADAQSQFDDLILVVR